MSNTDSYISYPVETDASALAKAAIQELMALQPGLVPNESNLEIALIEVISTMEAETRYVASLVPGEIFRYAGQSLFNLPPIDGAPATAQSTWTMRDTAGYTIPAGTLVAYPTSGNTSLYFRTQSTVVVPPGGIQTSDNEVVLVAVEYGAEYNDLPIQTVNLVDALVFVSSVTTTSVTSGGVDRESNDAYLDRLRQNLRLLSPEPIQANDFAILARNVAGVGRAVGIDNYDPVDGTYDNERMVTVAVTDSEGEAVSQTIKDNVASYLESLREVNFVVHVIDPTYVSVDVNATVKPQPGYDPAAVATAATQAVTAFLQPYSWPWTNTLRYNQLLAVLAQVPGVLYVDNINTPSEDLHLGSAASLVRPGQISVIAGAVGG